MEESTRVISLLKPNFRAEFQDGYGRIGSAMMGLRRMKIPRVKSHTLTCQEFLARNDFGTLPRSLLAKRFVGWRTPVIMTKGSEGSADLAAGTREVTVFSRESRQPSSH